MLQSLTDFNAYVDGRLGTQADKDAIKAAALTLSRAAMREAVAHANEHLDAALLDNPADLEMAARVSMMQGYLGSVTLLEG